MEVKLHGPEANGVRCGAITTDRVRGWIVMDEGHLTESQLLADSREYYASCQHTQEASYLC